MHLLISGNKDLVTIDFGKWLIPKISKKLISSVNNTRLKLWDNYFKKLLSNDTSSFEKSDDITLTLVFSCAEKLVCVETKDGILIQIDPELKINNIKLSVLSKTLNFGTLTQQGYPIFTDTYEYFSENIRTFFKMYLISRGIYVY